MKPTLQLALLTSFLAGAPAWAAAGPVDAEMLVRVFGVTPEPGVNIHDKLGTQRSVGDFELDPGQCIAAVHEESPVESVEVLHKQAVFDVKAYSVERHTLVLIRDSARRTYFVQDAVIREVWTTRDPVFGAMGQARQMAEAYRQRLAQSLNKNPRCAAPQAPTAEMAKPHAAKAGEDRERVKALAENLAKALAGQ